MIPNFEKLSFFYYFVSIFKFTFLRLMIIMFGNCLKVHVLESVCHTFLICFSFRIYFLKEFLVEFRYQVTLAHLKDKPAPSTPTAPSSSFSASSGVRSAAARLLGGSNGSRALSFVGGNGGSKSNGGNSRIGSLGYSGSSNSMGSSNFDGKGSYLVFNVGDAIFISDLNSQDKVIWYSSIWLLVRFGNFGLLYDS